MKPDIIIFPDGSLKQGNKRSYAGYGSVILDPERKQYTILNGSLNSSSIVYCEGWAVYKSFVELERYRKMKGIQFLKVLVVSDSKLTVQTFSEWIKYSWDLTDWYDWKKGDGQSVKNQELYRRILKIMNNEHYKVKFVHINSHSNNKRSSIEKIRMKLQYAKIRLDDNALKTFIEMNRLADEAATSITSANKEADTKPNKWIHLIRRKDN